ncbi:hypothetical protein GCM10018987_53620 [Streptomyces cremeus]
MAAVWPGWRSLGFGRPNRGGHVDIPVGGQLIEDGPYRGPVPMARVPAGRPDPVPGVGGRGQRPRTAQVEGAVGGAHAVRSGGKSRKFLSSFTASLAPP